MKNKRQTYRVILQLMTYIGVMVLLWVLFNTVFTPEEKKEVMTDKIEMLVQQLAQGRITQVLWQGKKVSILHRNDRKKGSFFVFYDLGDSGNCPLFFKEKVLKDTCTGTRYDQNGVAIGLNRADDLKSPPHYFMATKNKIMIGAWE